MTRRSSATATAILALALLLAPLGTARAGDDVDGDSPAAQAFRDGWWAETSEGKLDAALEHYEKAAAAEGPASVQARAYYRMGVVLHRMGKTQEAIQALERLAKEHPGEADLQAKARERLEEWTAVDLRTDFEAWYRRYQYSPEFQARIVELVLSLSRDTSDPAIGSAYAELLTIGAPALPALRAHLESSNDKLRGRVVDLLMRLGEIPDADSLLGTYDWKSTRTNWSLLLGAPEEKKRELLEALEGREGSEQLRAVLGPRSGWAEAYRRYHQSPLLYALLSEDPDPKVVNDLKALVGTFDDSRSSYNRELARALIYGGHVTDAEMLAWLARGSSNVAQQVLHVFGERPELPAGTFEAVLDRMGTTRPGDDLQGKLFPMLVTALGEEPTDARLSAAVKATERAWTGRRIPLFLNVSYSGGPPAWFRAPATLRLLEAIVERAKDPALVKTAMDRWSEAKEGNALVARQMLAWAQAPLDPENRERAALWAGSTVTARTLDELLAAMGDMEPAQSGQVWLGLVTHRALQGLPWDDEHVLELLSIAAADRGKGEKVSGRVDRFHKTFFSEQHRVAQLVRLALEAPRRVPAFAARTVPSALRSSKRIQGLIRDGFEGAWREADLAGKSALLDALERFLLPLFGDDALGAFFRDQLRAHWAAPDATDELAEERSIKRRILNALPTLSLDDLKVVYDLSEPADAAEAASVVLPVKMDRTTALYDALEAVRRTDDRGARNGFFRLFSGGASEPALRRRALTDQAADPWPFLRAAAAQELSAFRNAGDVAVFRDLLKDESPLVRHAAAKALALVYDRTAIKALVRALDDKDPNVRDAVLETLDTIKAIEQKKEYWRRAVRHNGTMPAED